MDIKACLNLKVPESCLKKKREKAIKLEKYWWVNSFWIANQCVYSFSGSQGEETMEN